MAASALLELSTLETDPTKRQKYFQAGEDILRSLMTFRDASGKLVYLTQGTNNMALLMNEEGSWSDNQETSFIWGDYYFLEALQRYDGIVLPVNFLWNARHEQPVGFGGHELELERGGGVGEQGQPGDAEHGDF